MPPACGRRISFHPGGALSSTVRSTSLSSRAAWPRCGRAIGSDAFWERSWRYSWVCAGAQVFIASRIAWGTGVPNTILINRLFRRIHSSTGSSVVSTIYVPLRFDLSLALSVRCANAHRQRSGLKLCFLSINAIVLLALVGPSLYGGGLHHQRRAWAPPSRP